jgi:hypothetical protein
MFKVPERQRITLDQHPTLGSDASYGCNGAFRIDSPTPGWHLFLICSDGTEAFAKGTPSAEWEHVSVQARNANGHRIPTWKEMQFVKDVCWGPEDVVVQYHPKQSQYVNHHPSVLHLWRWKVREFPTPPTSDIGPK